MRILITIIIFLSISLFVGCGEGKYSAPELRDDTVDYSTVWQYRWGDSPFNERGEPKWAIEDVNNPDWKHLPELNWAPGKPKEDRHLWQRAIFPQIDKEHDTLLLLGVWQAFDAYIDGKVVYSFSDFDSEGRSTVVGTSWHMIPLVPEYSGKRIYLRIYSDDQYIGIFKGSKLGSRAAHLLWIVRKDAQVGVMAVIYLFLSMIMLSAYIRNRTEMTNISFGLFTFCVGMYAIARTDVRQLFLNSPEIWSYVELLAMSYIPASLAWFSEHLFGVGPLKMFRRISRGWVLYVTSALIYAGFFESSLWAVLVPIQVGMLIVSVIFLISLFIHFRKGGIEAKIFFLGGVFLVLGAVHDIIVSMTGWLPSNPFVNHFTFFIFVMCLAYIVGLRLVTALAVKDSLEMASVVQDLLLPEKGLSSKFDRFGYGGFYEPFGRMAGDWVNFWEVNEDETRLILGDVVGKGPHAALAVAAIAAFIEDAKLSNKSMEETIGKINAGLLKLFKGHVATTFTAVELKRGAKARLFNCAGTGWLHIHGKVDQHVLPSAFLGMKEDYTIGSVEIDIADGDMVLAFTDGVLEGTRQVRKLIKHLQKVDQSKLTIDELFQAALQVGAENKTEDDKSILAVKASS